MFVRVATVIVALTLASAAAAQAIPSGMSEREFYARQHELTLRTMMREEIERDRWRRAHPEPPITQAEIAAAYRQAKAMCQGKVYPTPMGSFICIVP
jgi:hypothetical protein